MDFDRYGIEEWGHARPEQLARAYSNAVADEKLVFAFLKKLVRWRKNRRQTDAGAEMLAANQV